MIKLISFVFVTILFLISCKDDHISKDGKSNSNDSLVKNNFNLNIDTAFISLFYKKNLISDSIQKETIKFYKRRQNKAAWFNKDGLNDAVLIFYNQIQNYQYNFADSSFYNKELDSLIIKSQSDELNFLAKKNKIQNLDLLLTTTFFKYAEKVYGGKAKKLSDLEWFIPRQYKNYQSTLDSLVLISKIKNEQIPLNENYFLLKHQLKKYRDIEKNGGFPFVLASKHKYQIGDNDSNLLVAKTYFLLAGDLKNNDKTIVFTESLQKAIQYFQQRMGLEVNGNLDSITAIELNKPISFRIKQMMINIERLRWAPVEMGKNYLIINIPEFKLHLFENGKQIWITNIIVGKLATQTTIFKGNVSQIILNPYWGIPASIANNETVPHIKRNSRYLANNNIEVFSGNKIINPSTINWNRYQGNVPFFFRQRPGRNNALGRIKFLFPNTFDIYLHDTPSKQLFGDTKRAFSHGCIRVADPKKLALFILKDNIDWNEKKVDEILRTEKSISINISPTIPIYIVYFTAWVDSNGQLNFRNDIYDLDNKLSKEIFGE